MSVRDFGLLADRRYTTRYDAVFTDRISESGNAIASFRSSVRPFPIYTYLLNRLTVDLGLLHVAYVGHDRSSQGTEDQGRRSRSRSWVRLMRSV